MLDIPTTQRFINDCVSFHFDIVQGPTAQSRGVCRTWKLWVCKSFGLGLVGFIGRIYSYRV